MISVTREFRGVGGVFEFPVWGCFRIRGCIKCPCFIGHREKRKKMKLIRYVTKLFIKQGGNMEGQIERMKTCLFTCQHQSKR